MEQAAAKVSIEISLFAFSTISHAAIIGRPSFPNVPAILKESSTISRHLRPRWKVRLLIQVYWAKIKT